MPNNIFLLLKPSLNSSYILNLETFKKIFLCVALKFVKIGAELVFESIPIMLIQLQDSHLFDC